MPLRLMVALALSAAALMAAPEAATPRRAQSPVVTALDRNADGIIDAAEISRATPSLTALDLNGDGQLTRDELRPGTARTPSPAPPGAPPAAPLPALSPAPAGTRPNVLVIVADDLGWNGVGFHDPAAPTPNLDRLAKDGTELRRFYTYPVCSPARAAFLTGQLPRRFGIVDPLGPRQTGLPAKCRTLPEIFRSAGYRTSLVGKWHLGSRLPRECGFDRFYGFLGPQIDYFQHTDHRGEPDWQRDGTQLTETGYSTDLLAAEAIRQIEQRDPARPFFLELAFNSPHVPLAAPAELVAKHAAKGGLYAAVIEAMDLAIGRVLAALDTQGLRSQTLVVFFSDNGAGRRFSSNTPLRDGKDSIHEGGIRTPCVIRWPGKIAAGAVTGQPVSVQDLLPTLTAAAGLTQPAGLTLDGSDQWPALAAGTTRPRPPILIATRDLALIDADWKFIELESGGQALYHLAKDPGESTDLSKSAPETAARLKTALDKLRRDLPPAPANQPKPGAR